MHQLEIEGIGHREQMLARGPLEGHDEVAAAERRGKESQRQAIEIQCLGIGEMQEIGDVHRQTFGSHTHHVAHCVELVRAHERDALRRLGLETEVFHDRLLHPREARRDEPRRRAAVATTERFPPPACGDVLGDRRQEGARIDGLDHVVDRAEREGARAIGLVGSRRTREDHGDVAQLLVLLDAFADLIPVRIGQHDVEDDQVGPCRLEECERALAGFGGQDVVALLGERVLDDLETNGLVLDAEHERFRARFAGHVSSSAVVLSPVPFDAFPASVLAPSPFAVALGPSSEQMSLGEPAGVGSACIQIDTQVGVAIVLARRRSRYAA